MKKVRMNVESVSWYSHSVFRPLRDCISSSSAGGTARRGHVSWQPNLAARSIATPKPIEKRTGTNVIESTVPVHLRHSHAPSALYSQMTGRFDWSETAHSVSWLRRPASQPGVLPKG